MDTLRIVRTNMTLVDQVEDRLLNYFKENNLQIGDPIPNEMDLAASLGVARNVLREALSRLKNDWNDRVSSSQRNGLT